MNTLPSNTPTRLILALAAWGVMGLAGLQAADWPQWRGPQRNAVSSETGLLKQWPNEGPKLLWQASDLGMGYSTPSVVGERLYVQGNEGLDDEFVQARAVADGRLLWRTRLGKVGNPNQKPNFPAARSTPTVDGTRLYALGSDGDLACLDAATGKVLWQKNLRADFGGKPGDWAYAESPLVDRQTVLVTPGGAEAALLALNKNSGEPLWKTALSAAETAAYTSPMVVEADGTRQYVQMLEKGLAGVDAKTGQVLWRYDRTVSRYRANVPSPVVRGETIFSAGAGTGAGLIRLKRDAGNWQVEQAYFSPKLPTAIGGAVLVGDLLYGTTAQGLLAVDWATGKVVWDHAALGAASLLWADDRLYLHGENGAVALADAGLDGYREQGRFTPPNPPARRDAMEKSWTYPVVANGRLYLRDHQMLWCYDVRAGAR